MIDIPGLEGGPASSPEHNGISAQRTAPPMGASFKYLSYSCGGWQPQQIMPLRAPTPVLRNLGVSLQVESPLCLPDPFILPRSFLLFQYLYSVFASHRSC